MELRQQISNRLQALLAQKGLTQQQAAYRCNMDAATFNRIIKCKSNITIKTIQRIETVLETKILTVTHE